MMLRSWIAWLSTPLKGFRFAFRPGGVAQAFRATTSGDQRLAKEDLLLLTKKHFLSCDWVISPPADYRGDMIVSSEMLTFSIQLVERLSQQFKSGAAIVATMENDAGYFKSTRNQALIFVMNFEFPSLPPRALAERDMVALNVDDLQLVTRLPRFLVELPVDIDPREELLLCSSLDACLQISRNFFEAGDRDRALLWARRAVEVKRGPNSPFRKLFRHFIQLGDPQFAESYGMGILAFTPENEEIIGELIDLTIKNGNLEEALKLGHRLKKLRPLDPNVHNQLATLLLRREEFDDAIESVMRAIELDPTNRQFLRNAVLIATEAKDLTRTASFLAQTAAAFPADPHANDALINHFINQADYTAADLSVEAALKVDPNSVMFLRKSARIKMQIGDVKATHAALQRWIQLAPTDAHAYDTLAGNLLQQKDLVAAKEAISQALRLQPDNAAFLRKAARIASESGDFEEAVEKLQRLLLVSPSDGYAQDTLATLFLHLKDYPAALVAAATAIEIEPGNPAFVKKAARVALESGKLSVAIAHLERLVVLVPDDVIAQKMLLMAHEQKSRQERHAT